MDAIIIKNKVAIEKMRSAGKLLAQVMQETEPFVKEGISTHELDQIIEKKMRERELKPECKGYAGYRHSSCISLNDVIVHGVPKKEIILKSGDFVKIDIVGSYKGYCADMARCFFVGEASPVAQKMAEVAQRALDKGISLVRPGIRLSDISACVQREVEQAGFGVVRDFAGHGIGKNIHEAPDVPNFGKSGQGPILQEGMTLAIEPMITEKDYAVKIMADGWTAKTVDGGLAAHIEDTVVVVRDGAEILTRIL
ncbi:type I methionyl aminopeptidase [Candidatus Babeliales bacterium]|nr:type I methionyl aminopeptidase [Candidatus Babeliales bacterium]